MLRHRRKRCLPRLCGAGKPSSAKTRKTYGGAIAPGLTIVHDGDHSHKALAETLGLKEGIRATAETKGIADDENPTEPINEIHRYLAGFVRAHSGLSREDLQGWLNLFSSAGTPVDVRSKRRRRSSNWR